MKKLLAKVRSKKQPEEPAGRITTDTLAEHREKVLAGGRKFKYPVQYQRHKLVINAALIGTAALIILVGVLWYLLYVAQSTSEFIYRVTKVVPVPVAVVEGEQVRYSDYLMQYRSQVHYLTEKEQLDISSEDGKRQLAYVKTQSMSEAIADAYANKLARELDIDVSDADLEAFLKQQRQASDGEVSETTYNSVIEDYYGWSPDEYRDAMKQKLLRQKVTFAVDTTADELNKKIESTIAGGETNLQTIADANKNTVEVMYMAGNFVPRNNRDGGLTATAVTLQPGQVSKAVKTTSGNGYYFVKLLESNESQVKFEYIFVPLTVFDERLKAAQADDKLKEFINVKKS